MLSMFFICEYTEHTRVHMCVYFFIHTAVQRAQVPGKSRGESAQRNADDTLWG